MEIVIKIAVVAVVVAVLSLLVKQFLPEYAVLVQLAGICVILVYVVTQLPQLTRDAGSLLSFAGIGDEWLQLLLKALGIAVVTQLASDICNDNGSAALTGVVELGGKVLILLLAVPLLRAVAELAVGLLGS